jgi:hypothetical protein
VVTWRSVQHEPEGECLGLVKQGLGGIVRAEQAERPTCIRAMATVYKDLATRLLDVQYPRLQSPA